MPSAAIILSQQPIMYDDEVEYKPDHIVENREILDAINEAFDDPELSVIESLDSAANDFKDDAYYTFLGLTDKYVLRKIPIDDKVAYRMFKYEGDPSQRIEVTTFYPPDDENDWKVEIFDTSEDVKGRIVMKVNLNLFLKKSGISTPPPEIAGGTRRARRNSGRVGGRVSAGGLRSKARVGSATRAGSRPRSRVSTRRAQRRHRMNRVLPK